MAGEKLRVGKIVILGYELEIFTAVIKPLIKARSVYACGKKTNHK